MDGPLDRPPVQAARSACLHGAGPAVPGSAQFTVVSWKGGPVLAIPGRIVTRLASLGARVFTAVMLPADRAKASIQEWDLSTGLWAQLGPEFGPDPGGSFFRQSITEMRVFEGVPTGDGGQENLLLITTLPDAGDWDHQGVLWGYSVCAPGAPQLRFAVSLGAGAEAYTPSMDQANGLISLSRVSSSVAIVSVPKAIQLWDAIDPRLGRKPIPSDAKDPLGACQGAIVQPFYLANPDTSLNNVEFAYTPGSHWSAAMLPSLDAGGGASVDVAVGYSQSTPEGAPPQTGSALSGVPVWRKPYVGDTWLPEVPFQGPEVYGAASTRAFKGPDNVTGRPRVAVVAGITVKAPSVSPDGYVTNLALAIVTGPAAGTASVTRLAVMDEKDPVNPKLLSVWPTTDLLGQAVPFMLQRGSLVVDPISKLAALAVTKYGDASGVCTWYVLDLTTPETPAVIAVIPGMGWVGSMYGGYLTGLSQGQLQMVSLPIAQVSQSVKGQEPVARAGVGSAKKIIPQSSIQWVPPPVLLAICLQSGMPIIERALPERAALITGGVPDLQKDIPSSANQPISQRLNIPESAWISIPFQRGERGAVVPVGITIDMMPVIPKGEEGYYILKVKLPAINAIVNGIDVNMIIGNQPYPINFTSGDRIIYTDDPNSGLNMVNAGDYLYDDPITQSERQKQWLSRWLPESINTEGLVRYFKVRVTPWPNMTYNAWPVYGQHLEPGQDAIHDNPPIGGLNFAFRIRVNWKGVDRWSEWYDSNARPSAFGVRANPISQKTMWSLTQRYGDSARYYDGQEKNGKRWTDLPTYRWGYEIHDRKYSAEGQNNSRTLWKLGVITRSHGNNQGHKHMHHSGNSVDVFPPGADLFSNLLNPVQRGFINWGSGTMYRDSLRAVCLTAAVAQNTPQRVQAREILGKWVRATRAGIIALFNSDAVSLAPEQKEEFRVERIVHLRRGLPKPKPRKSESDAQWGAYVAEFLGSQAVRNGLEDVALARLFQYGQVLNLSIVIQASGTVPQQQANIGSIDLTNIGDWSVPSLTEAEMNKDYKGLKMDEGDVHTHHAHLEILATTKSRPDYKGF